MSDPRLLLYISPDWRAEGVSPSPLLYPFWGNPASASKPLFRALFERHTFDTERYGITDDAEQADIVFLPYDHATALRAVPELIAVCANKAAALGKPLLIDGMGDIEYPVTIPHAIVLRYGGYRFSLKPNEIVMPLYTDDLLEACANGELQLRAKQEKAVVGFSGWASLTLKQELRAVLKELPVRIRAIFDSRYRACKKGIFFRRDALRLLSASSMIESNFMIRTTYSGHTDTASADPVMLQKEMAESLLRSDYGLDVRGDANASMRLFETLSLGRIPVIIDTERNFPFSNVLDYSSFALIVNFRELHRLPEIIAGFHAALTDDAFKEMQRKARVAYLSYFRVDAIVSHLVRELRNRGVGST
ncbi:MAG: hypothetical protein JWL88_417 [Parcubacteria group bacterium]|nr:hypothetical protein [Parcubacteria group bacterium]